MFNGQNSVLWCNIRDAFGTEISQMYRTLRSNGVLSYETVEQRFEEHQDKWPEAVFNEDAWAKYINPLIAPAAGKTPTASYLSMAQGSKKEQRKWWLYNRFRYMDSKWTAGDARNNIIELRGYAKANITVTPYSDIYPAVRYASYTVTERGTHGVPTTLVCPIDTLNDSEIWIFSAPQLASVGDLSPLKVGRADFRAATNLQDIRVGSNASGYENPNLTELFVGNNSLLRVIDARNCTALAGALDFSGASNVEHVYLDGTAVTSVSLPAGGILKTLSLPDTITNLTVRNQPGITSFSMEGGDYSSITTLRVENSGTSIPVLAILDEMAPNSRVRIIGFTALAESTSDVEDFFDYLDSMRGLDESGNNLDAPVVSGTITGLDTITGAWLAEMNSRYPDVTIQYQHISSTLSYYSWDGQTLITTETIADGGNGTYAGTPSRTSTAQYSYDFIGWSLYQDQSVADPTATQNVGADRSVYAAYSHTTRTYTITWKNANGAVLETDQNVPYGSTPQYNGATPTQDGETSTGWNPSVSTVVGDQIYTAVYIPVYQVRFYSGSSSSSSGTLLQTINVQEGSTAVYSGSTPTHSESYMEFTGWDKPLTNIRTATDFYAQYRDTRSAVIQYVEGTMTEYSSDTATAIARNAFTRKTSLVTATTSATSIGQAAFSNDTSLVTVDLTSNSEITIASSAFEQCSRLANCVVRSATMANVGSGMFNGTAIEKKLGAVFVPNALVDTYKGSPDWGSFTILPLSEYPTQDYSTIRESWASIISAVQNGMAHKYSVGEKKLLDVGQYGTVYATVAKSDRTGITFIADRTLNTSMSFMDSANSDACWRESSLRAWLNNDVLSALPAELQSAIAQTAKYSRSWVNGSLIQNDESLDRLWIPSMQEVFGGTSYDTGGEQYEIHETSKGKYSPDGSAVANWWTRSATSNSKSCCIVTHTGSNSTASSASTKMGVVIGFTIGTHLTEQENWEALEASINNGTLKQIYSTGDCIPLNLGEEGTIRMQIVAFDEDVSHVSLVAKECLYNPHNMNETTTAVGGWKDSALRAYLTDTILPLVPSYVSNNIVPVTKYSYVNNSAKDDETTDTLWIPSSREVNRYSPYGEAETSGLIYSDIYKSGQDSTRMKKQSRQIISGQWWLRTVSGTQFRAISASGSLTGYQSTNRCGIALGFCL